MHLLTLRLLAVGLSGVKYDGTEPLTGREALQAQADASTPDKAAEAAFAAQEAW